MKTIQERIDSVIQLQRDFFASGATKDPEMRKNQLLKLKHVIQKYEKEISEALFLDLHKSPEESFLTEIQVVLSEIDYHIKHLTRWCKPRKVPFSLFTFPGQGRIIHEPYGHVLIIAPWNYPFQLLMSPLVGAISAGNCIILKPSPLSAHTSALMAKMISEYFPERYIALFEGDIPVNQALLSHPFDYIFFTGGPGFGKYVAGCAAAHLTPVTLELGGKSPCIVTEKADLEITAHRIIWGKLLNAGQTCIAPDYILVDKKIKTELIKKLKKYILQDFGANPLLSEHYPRIISQEATERLTSLINNESPNILFGGQTDIIQRYVAPTLIDEPAPDGKLMQEEIFGPILPILGYDKIEDAITFVNKKDKPLALYFFGNKQDAKQVMQSTSSGGMCVNDTIMHIVNSHLPFGGVGKSGMGNYHGHASFLTFSHSRSVHTGSWVPDFKFRYAPYKLPQIIKRFL